MRAVIIASVLCLGLSGGCTTTTVHFHEPEGTKMVFGGKSYTWPAEIDLVRPAEPPDVLIHDLKMFIPTADGVIRARGEIHIYGYYPKTVDKYAANDCSIDAEHIRKILEGYAVTIDGYSAGGDRIYRIILGREE